MTVDVEDILPDLQRYLCKSGIPPTGHKDPPLCFNCSEKSQVQDTFSSEVDIDPTSRDTHRSEGKCGRSGDSWRLFLRSLLVEPWHEDLICFQPCSTLYIVVLGKRTLCLCQRQDMHMIFNPHTHLHGPKVTSPLWKCLLQGRTVNVPLDWPSRVPIDQWL